MKIFNLYESVLKEEETTKNVQSCIRHFGHELFGDQISYKEPNTSIESKFAEMIYNFTDFAYGTQLSTDNPGFIAAMNKLQSCMSSYPEILMPEDTSAYRGISFTLDKAIKLWQSVNGKTQFKLKYTPMHYIESWTESVNVGIEFAHMSQTPWLSDLATTISKLKDPNDIINAINEEMPSNHYHTVSKVGFALKFPFLILLTYFVYLFNFFH
jgi:hypothetical protein